MTDQMVRQAKIERPAITPLIGTLLDVADITEGIGWLEAGVGLYESYNCITTDRRANWPCPPVFTAAPVQTASATATTGGTLPAGTYRFKITAVNGDGGETVVSNEISQVTTGTTSTVTVNWNDVAGAERFRIYATAGAVNTEKFLVEVGDVNTYIWTGTPAISATNPPGSNTFLAVKVTENPSWPDAARFAVYAAVECKRFGSTAGTDALADTEDVFLAKESYGVERAVIETVLQGATDLTPAGGAVSLTEAIGILEGDAATKYAGVPTIHLPRTFGSPGLGALVLVRDGNRIYTAQGSKVASGGGYVASNMSPAAVPPAAGELWVYASGEVSVGRGAVMARNDLDRSTNDNLDLVERPYVVAVDCYISAIRVRITE